MRTDCFLYITSHKWNSCLSVIDHARLFMHEFLTLPLLHMLLVRKYTADYNILVLTVVTENEVK
jgi:hypothetical protein